MNNFENLETFGKSLLLVHQVPRWNRVMQKKVYIKISRNCPFNWIPCSGGLVLFIILNGGERCAYVEPVLEVSAVHAEDPCA